MTFSATQSAGSTNADPTGLRVAKRVWIVCGIGGALDGADARPVILIADASQAHGEHIVDQWNVDCSVVLVGMRIADACIGARRPIRSNRACVWSM